MESGMALIYLEMRVHLYSAMYVISVIYNYKSTELEGINDCVTFCGKYDKRAKKQKLILYLGRYISQQANLKLVAFTSIL